MFCVGAPRVRRVGSGLSLTMLAVALAFAHGVDAETGLTLDEAMRDAAAQSARVRAQSSLVAAAEAQAQRAGQLPDPELLLGIENVPIEGDAAFRLGADEMTMRRIGVMQEWPSRLKRDARRNAALAEAAVVRAEIVSTEVEVARAGGRAWLELWAAHADRDGLDRQIDDADRVVRIAEARLRSATGDATSVLAAQSDRAELERERRELEARIQAARAGLVRWLGASAATVELADAPDFARLPLDVESMRRSVDRHATLQSWDSRERAATAAAKLAQAEKRPDVEVGVSYGARSAGLPDMAMLEVRVGLPLFASRRQDRDIAARLAQRDAVQAEREDALREQRELLDRTIATWEGLRDQRDLYESSLLPLARDRTSVALAAYSGGGAIEPWLEAREDESALRRRYVQDLAELGETWLVLSTLMPLDERKETRP